jgi:dephospho-CoA kinase
MKVAICGKMASGKTTIAEVLCSELGFHKFSLAGGVKDLANYLFDIPEGHKDRVAYQKVGDGARKTLYQNIWIDVLKGKVRESGQEFVVVDDVRYVNEAENLRRDGWFIIKLEIAEDLQIERLMETYPDDWEIHADARNHASELEVDLIPDSVIDLKVVAKNSIEPNEYVLEVIRDYITMHDVVC